MNQFIEKAIWQKPNRDSLMFDTIVSGNYIGQAGGHLLDDEMGIFLPIRTDQVQDFKAMRELLQFFLLESVLLILLTETAGVGTLSVISATCVSPSSPVVRLFFTCRVCGRLLAQKSILHFVPSFGLSDP